MLNIESLYKDLSIIESGKIYDCPNFRFGINEFIEDWIGEPFRDWEKSLSFCEGIVNDLLDQFNLAREYEFMTYNEFCKNNPEITFTEEVSDDFPKKVDDLLNDFVLKDSNEEMLFLRHNQSDRISIELKKMKLVLKECIEKYRKEKDSELFKPTYHDHERIPFFGSEQHLSYFFKLLIDGGFILASDTDVNLKTSKVFNTDFLNSLNSSKNKRDLFKQHLVKKKTLAKRVSNYFVCIENSSEDNPKGFNVFNPKSEGLGSRMNDSGKIRMGSDDLDRFRVGFKQIVEILNP